MKKMLIILGTATLVLAGCASTQVGVAPVGPDPATVAPVTGNGQLEVYSALSARSEGNNPTWRQHSSYYIYTASGRRLRHVDNAPGYYSTLPRLVTLPPGEYIVKARAKDALWTRVPVVIKPNEITRVHLDGNWQPNAPGVEVVMAPQGYAIGWRAH
ncbi:MAG TPA: hypothetical protein VMF08_01590 [Candidatus Sulfotelmatobacter sp.]|nr:hypothetical protein [Candidatus Sulfotelmatobacter sp.]